VYCSIRYAERPFFLHKKQTKTLKSRHLLFVINPISGDNDKDQLQQQIADWANGQEVTYDIFMTSAERCVERLSAKLREKDFDAVIAAGGDGTLNVVAQVVRVLKLSIAIGIIPLGSANGMAKELDIPPSVEEALNIIAQFNTYTIDAILVNEQHLCLHIGDIGLNAAVVKGFEREDSRGMGGYLKQLLKELLNPSTVKYQIKTDDGEHRVVKALMVAFANASRYGTGAIVNPTGELGDGKFELCIFEPFPVWKFFRILISFFIGTLDRSDYVRYLSCTSVTVEAKQPQELQIDGELFGESDSVEARILPKCFTFLVPGQ